MARKRNQDYVIAECEETLENVYIELENVRRDREALTNQQELLEATITQYEEDIRQCREMQEESQRRIEICQRMLERLRKLATAAGYTGSGSVESVLSHIENAFANARAEGSSRNAPRGHGGPSGQGGPSGRSRQPSPPGPPPCPFSTPEDFRRVLCEEDAQYVEFMDPATPLDRKKTLYKILALRYHPDKMPEYRACSQDIRGACFNRMSRPR